VLACFRNGDIDPLTAIHQAAEYHQNLARLIELVVAPSLQALQVPPPPPDTTDFYPFVITRHCLLETLFAHRIMHVPLARASRAAPGFC